jgi:hypothetical protein
MPGTGTVGVVGVLLVPEIAPPVAVFGAVLAAAIVRVARSA